MALYEMIREMPMFKHFSEEEKKQFARMDLSLQRFNEGDIIFMEGELYSSMYLLIQGSVVVTKSKSDIPLAKLKPGDVFGEMSFLSKKPRHSSVVTAENVLVIRIDEDFFDRISRQMEIKIKDYFIEILISRLDRMNQSIVQIAKFASGRVLG